MFIAFTECIQFMYTLLSVYTDIIYSNSFGIIIALLDIYYLYGYNMQSRLYILKSFSVKLAKTR